MVSEAKQLEIILKLSEKGGEFLQKKVNKIPANHIEGLTHLLAIAPMIMKEEDGTAEDAVQDLIDHLKDVAKRHNVEDKDYNTPVELLEEFKETLKQDV